MLDAFTINKLFLVLTQWDVLNQKRGTYEGAPQPCFQLSIHKQRPILG